jgi:hypothetical protein
MSFRLVHQPIPSVHGGMAMHAPFRHTEKKKASDASIDASDAFFFSVCLNANPSHVCRHHKTFYLGTHDND